MRAAHFDSELGDDLRIEINDLESADEKSSRKLTIHSHQKLLFEGKTTDSNDIYV